MRSHAAHARRQTRAVAARAEDNLWANAKRCSDCKVTEGRGHLVSCDYLAFVNDLNDETAAAAAEAETLDPGCLGDAVYDADREDRP